MCTCDVSSLCIIFFLFLVPVEVQLADSRYSVNENVGSLTVCAELVRGALEREASIMLYTVDGTATSTDPADFSAISHHLTFDQTTSRVCADVSISDDHVVENDETFSIMIGGGDSGVTFVTPTSAVVTIVDNDIVTIGLQTDRFQGSEGEQTDVCASVRGISTLERSVTVRISTIDRSAQGDTKLTVTHDLSH